MMTSSPPSRALNRVKTFERMMTETGRLVAAFVWLLSPRAARFLTSCVVSPAYGSVLAVGVAREVIVGLAHATRSTAASAARATSPRGAAVGTAIASGHGANSVAI